MAKPDIELAVIDKIAAMQARESAALKALGAQHSINYCGWSCLLPSPGAPSNRLVAC